MSTPSNRELQRCLDPPKPSWLAHLRQHAAPGTTEILLPPPSPIHPPSREPGQAVDDRCLGPLRSIKVWTSRVLLASWNLLAQAHRTGPTELVPIFIVGDPGHVSLPGVADLLCVTHVGDCVVLSGSRGSSWSLGRTDLAECQEGAKNGRRTWVDRDGVSTKTLREVPSCIRTHNLSSSSTLTRKAEHQPSGLGIPATAPVLSATSIVAMYSTMYGQVDLSAYCSPKNWTHHSLFSGEVVLRDIQYTSGR